MSGLQIITSTVQQIADAIASILEMEVTIVDSDLRRIAGTGHYRERTGEILTAAPIFRQALQDGQGIVVADPGKHSVCFSCANKDGCEEEAEMCCPITLNGSILGVIALIAFTPQQKQLLLQRREELFFFIHQMAELLASKSSAEDRLSELNRTKNQLETVINTVRDGIITVNCDGIIVRLNSAAKKILGLRSDEGIGLNFDELFPELALKDSIRRKKEIINREISGMIHKRLINCITTVIPWEEAGTTMGAVASLQEMEAVKQIVSRYRRTFGCDTDMILGISPAIEQAKKITTLAARSNTSVLIRGESGSGKELFARTLHCISERRDQAFVALNCAAIPESLLESELFGYDEGAFTGARKGGKAGKFELAHGGTLFLDEIGDMSLHLQAKFLRVLQEKRIERVGGTDSIAVDVRIVSATHKDIEAMVEKGEFRQDLYYRINVFPLVIPPLRQRREDIPGLIRHFLEKHCDDMEKKLISIDDDAYRILLTYDWPGNVRELENVMEYLVSIAAGNITLQHVASRVHIHNTCERAITTLAAMERQLIFEALERYGNHSEGKLQAAESLGISKATLYRKLKIYESE